MALNANKQLAVFRTASECLWLTWLLRLPYLVLVVIVALVAWTGPSAFGFYDPIIEFGALSPDPYHSEDYGEFPMGTWLLMTLLFIVGFLFFGIFWYRYLLLGPDRALRLGLSALYRVFWRSLGYLIVVGLAYVLLLVPLSFLVVLLLGVMESLGDFAAVTLTTALTLAASLLPLAFVTRLSLVFPAIAVEKQLQLKESWAAARGSTWRMVGTMLALYIPSFLLAHVANFAVFYPQGINVFDPQHAFAMYDHWIAMFVLSPLWCLPMALGLAVLAIAFRDLIRRDIDAEAAGEAQRTA